MEIANLFFNERTVNQKHNSISLGPKPRARDLGITFDGETGQSNGITDVHGVEVGYRTLIASESCRTGVTVILPRGRTGGGSKAWAGIHTFNGNGEMTGAHWIREAGHFSGPICITNTNGIGAAHEGLQRWLVSMDLESEEEPHWFLPVVAETWDGHLNNINGFYLEPRHVEEAINAAGAGALSEGNVGGGAGMCCYGFKGGSGTSSRRVATTPWFVGAFVQANFGRQSELMMRGVPAGKLWLRTHEAAGSSGGFGSIIVVIATDAPLHSRQLEGVARRATAGLARTGTSGQHSSGDIFLAFSTAACTPSISIPTETVSDVHLSGFFESTVNAVEEAILNALIGAESMVGYKGRKIEAIPHNFIRSLFYNIESKYT